MPRRALALLCLAACAAPESAASAPAQGSGRELEPAAAASPGPASNGPVPSDSPPVPSDSPPRLLAADVARFGVLADGALLIEPRPTWPEIDGVATYTPPGGLVRVDPGTGARTPWDAPWTATGWKLGRGGAPARIGFEVSPDGRWVAIAYSFEIRRSPALTRPELVALVVARSDGSDPRCVGVGVPSDDPPPYTFSRAGRLIGDWTVRCTPGPRGAPIAVRDDGALDPLSRLQRWYDPDDGSSGEVPELEPWWYDKDPLGDSVAMQDDEDPRAFAFRDVATGARLGAVPLSDGLSLRARDWVARDMLLTEVLRPATEPRALRLVTTDGRTFAAPHAQWRVYTRLPDGAHLFSRDGGATVEQGRVDWPSFTVEASRRRRDLERFVEPVAPGEPRNDASWTPGLGGVLIHDLETGGLYLAAI